MEIKLSTVVKKNNGNNIIMPEIFKNASCAFDNFEIKFEYKYERFIINLNSSVLDDQELRNIFWTFYSYLEIILGYFPEILEASFMDKNQLKNIVEQYKTKECFIRASEQYIQEIDNQTFFNSFKEYRKIYKNANFPVTIFNVSTMKSNLYPEITMVNVLQSLDGLFEVLFKDCRNDIINLKLNRIKDYLNTIDVMNIPASDYEKLKDDMTKVSNLHFIDKLRFYIQYTRFKVFKYEEDLDDNNKYYIDSLLSKLVNTRNKFSHSVTKKDTLNGKESALFMFKIVMLYRMLILKKIGIDTLIDEETFTNNLNKWNEYIYQELEKEEVNS